MSELLPKIREICRIFEIRPARSKGQNFLVNEKIYDEIAEASELLPTQTVLEVGPGLGFLTARLAKKAKRVVAVELDDKLANYLKTAIGAEDVENIEIINEDVLRFDLDSHIDPNEDYKIVANLPYNITSLFLRQSLEREHKPLSLVLMLQKEVAERIIAQAPDMSLLALSVQAYADCEIVRTVKAGNFWPEPQVDSAIIKITLKPEPPVEGGLREEKLFFRLARIGFSAKRKMIKNNLAGGLKLEDEEVEKALAAASVSPKARAEELSLEDWRNLFAALRAFMI